MRSRVPVNIMCTPKVSASSLGIVTESLDLIMRIAGVDGREIRNRGVWRPPGYKRGEELVPYGSIDWYLKVGFAAGRPVQLDANAMSNALIENPAQQEERTCSVIVTDRDIYAGNTSFVLGLALGDSFAIISQYRLMNGDWCEDPIECFRTVAFHELGHLCGLPSRGRDDTEFSLGWHCTNSCVMRQRLHLDGWNGLTRDRLDGISPFCASCQRDLQNWAAMDAPTESIFFRRIG